MLWYIGYIHEFWQILPVSITKMKKLGYYSEEFDKYSFLKNLKVWNIG